MQQMLSKAIAHIDLDAFYGKYSYSSRRWRPAGGLPCQPLTVFPRLLFITLALHPSLLALSPGGAEAAPGAAGQAGWGGAGGLIRAEPRCLPALLVCSSAGQRLLAATALPLR